MPLKNFKKAIRKINAWISGDLREVHVVSLKQLPVPEGWVVEHKPEYARQIFRKANGTRITEAEFMELDLSVFEREAQREERAFMDQFLV